MVAAIATMGVASQHEQRRRLTVVALRDLDTRVKTTPPPPAVEPEVKSPAPTVIPKPAIELPAPGPRQVALDVPPPTVQISAPAIVSAPSAAKAVAAAPGPASAPSVEGGDLSGTVLSAKPPAYPTEARRRHEQGTVKLLVLVGTDGRVEDITIATSSGSTLLDKAALRAVKGWRWTPSRQNGTAATVRGYVTIPFVLRSENGPLA